MIHLSELDFVIFETPATSITGVLLSELANKKIGVLFCNERHLPQGMYVPVTGNYINAGRIISQASWDNVVKGIVWKSIVQLKIDKQASLLAHYNHQEESSILSSYIHQVEEDDISNREGFAAKVFFNALYGDGFARREQNKNIECNACLDYGYSVLLSIVAKEIVSAGYELALGIHHRGTTNPYNLACDIMEPFRPIVDSIVLKSFKGCFDMEIKQAFWGLGSLEVRYGGAKSFLSAAINDFVYDVCRCMSAGGGVLPTYEILW